MLIFKQLEKEGFEQRFRVFWTTVSSVANFNDGTPYIDTADMEWEQNYYIA